MRLPVDFFRISITGLWLILGGCVSGYESGIQKAEIVEGVPGDSALTVIAGPEYEAGWMQRLFFGSHYRDLWTSPVRIEVLDLEHFAGGLTAVEAGGGFQTKSLRLKAAEGSFYKFRSVDKNPQAILPLELQNTIAGDIAKDQISMSHPAGALIVDELAGAVGVPRLHPRLVVLPDSPRLGAFQSSFGGLLGIYETYPDDVPDGTGFLGSRKIQNTMKMFEAMDDNSEDRPDAIAFLRARFLDVLVGDWDRHVKQWKWARFKNDGRDVWYPIPLDRDQAFAHLDGLFPWMASMAISQFENFSEVFNNISKLTFSGRFLDRRILVSLERPTWDSVAALFVEDLTDSVILRAVRQLPPGYFAMDGKRIIDALKSRRDTFHQIVDAYYRLLTRYVDIHLSDKKEFASVKRLDDRHVEVTAWRIGKTAGSPVFRRTFERGETNEIRLYMEGGDDSVVVEGDVGASIIVRVVGGKGDDVLIDRSEVHGVLWGLVPFIPQADHMTYFYDHQGNNRFESGASCSVDERKYSPPPGGITQY